MEDFNLPLIEDKKELKLNYQPELILNKPINNNQNEINIKQNFENN